MANSPALESAENPRWVAVLVLYDVLVQGRSVTQSLAEYLPYLDEASDKKFCHEMSFGVLRYYPSLCQTMEAYLKKPLKSNQHYLKLILCSAIYQIVSLQLPPYAVINEAVQLCKKPSLKWAAGLVNAVLRAIANNEPSPFIQDRYHDHPPWLYKKIMQYYGDNGQAICQNNHRSAPMMLRLHREDLYTREAYLALLAEQGIAATAHKDAKEAIVLERPVPVVQLPGFESGVVTVQDANAQLAANLLAIKPNQRVLDACAAPGGKTAHIAKKAQPIELTAIEIDCVRAQKLQQTLSRLGVQANVCVADLQDVDTWHDGRLFDRILLDAPCSATGVIRKHPDILHHRRASDVETLCALQRDLLNVCWSLLAPGGRLLYATCSILPEENHEQISWFLETYDEARLFSLAHNRALTLTTGANGQSPLTGVLQFLPDATGDGFFYAAIEKPA